MIRLVKYFEYFYKRYSYDFYQEALALLQPDMPFREVAGHLGNESIRQLTLREGVELVPRGQRLTPTERKLMPEQQQEARDLVAAGVSIWKSSEAVWGEQSSVGQALEWVRRLNS